MRKKTEKNRSPKKTPVKRTAEQRRKKEEAKKELKKALMEAEPTAVLQTVEAAETDGTAAVQTDETAETDGTAAVQTDETAAVQAVETATGQVVETATGEAEENEVEAGEKPSFIDRIKPLEPVIPLSPMEPVGDMFSPDPEEEGKKKKRVKFYETTKENDIRFKGVLSYRHLRIMGWICMAAAVIYMLLEVAVRLSPAVGEKYSVLEMILPYFKEFAVFLFLFANFAVIIDKKSSYKKLFIMYGGLTLFFVFLYIIIYYRYIGGFFKAIKGSREGLDHFFRGGFLTFNVFLDLLLCTAIIFFLDYRPKRFFTGNKIYLFRMFAALPILYECGCIYVKYICLEGTELHPMVSPFLTTKPVMCFLLFLRMALYMKGREKEFLKHGKTVEEYEAFLKTNRNSFQFAKKFALMTLIYALLDFVFVVLLIVINLGSQGLLGAYNALDDANREVVTIQLLEEMQAIGFGTSFGMIFFSPFILLFSYTKSYRKSKVDTLIPVVAVVVIALIVLEGIFRILCLVPDKFASFLESL